MAARIYVGNLPYNTDQQQLAQLFGAFGEVLEATVVMDRATGQSKGFGFVEMVNDDEARNAIASLNGTMLGNRTIRVNVAQPRVERPAGGRSAGYGGGYSDRGGYGGGSGYSDRGGYGGGAGNSGYGGGYGSGYSDRGGSGSGGYDRPRRRDDDRNGGYDRGNSYGGRRNDYGGYNDRSSGYGSADRDNRGGGAFLSYNDRDSYNNRGEW